MTTPAVAQSTSDVMGAGTVTVASSTFSVSQSNDVEERIKYLPRDCITCDGPDCDVKNPRHRCSRCQCNYYCSNKCQKNDWKSHKPYCVPVEELRMKHAQQQQIPTQSASTIESPSAPGNDVPVGTEVSTASASNTECPICLECPMKNTIVLKECGHGFCSSCIIQWQQYRKLMASLVIDFTSSAGVVDSSSLSAPVKSKQSLMNCPYCRTETEQNLEDDLMKKAMLLATRAFSDKVKPMKEMKDSLLKEALSYLNQILETEYPIIISYFTKAELLLELDDAAGAIETLKQLIETENERKNHPVFKLLDEQEEAVTRFDRATYDRLKEEIVVAAEQYGMPPTRLRSDAYYDVYMLQCNAYEKLNQWDDALNSYKQIAATVDENAFNRLTPAKQRQFYFGWGRSFYETGKYDAAIDLLDTAILMNRHFPGVHKHKALSQEQMGKTDDAVTTMNIAALYETPWDCDNQLQNLQLYEELLNKQKQLKENAAKDPN